MKNEYEIGRYELKYLLPITSRDVVLELVAPHVRPDDHAAPLQGDMIGYVVHSLYFDTPQLTDYFERLERRRVRQRLRVRTYGTPDDRHPLFLENKRKSGKWVVKHRAPVCCASSLVPSGGFHPWATLAASAPHCCRFAAASFCRLVDDGRRLPVSVVHYRREVLVPRSRTLSNVRLTLDYDIQATVDPAALDLFAQPDVELLPQGWMVMEMKFHQTAPGWMRALSRALGITAVPLSKFGLSVARGLRAGRHEELRALLPPQLLASGGLA